MVVYVSARRASSRVPAARQLLPSLSGTVVRRLDCRRQARSEPFHTSGKLPGMPTEWVPGMSSPNNCGQRSVRPRRERLSKKPPRRNRPSDGAGCSGQHALRPAEMRISSEQDGKTSIRHIGVASSRMMNPLARAIVTRPRIRQNE